MKATKLVIGAGILIALVGAMPAAAADDYESAFIACEGAPEGQAQCFINADDATTNSDPRACTVGTTIWRVQNGETQEPVECAVG